MLLAGKRTYRWDVDAELPPDPLSLTPEEKESAAAYLRTTFRLHPIEPDEKDPLTSVPAPVPSEEPTLKLVILKKDHEDDPPA